MKRVEIKDFELPYADLHVFDSEHEAEPCFLVPEIHFLLHNAITARNMDDPGCVDPLTQEFHRRIFEDVMVLMDAYPIESVLLEQPSTVRNMWDKDPIPNHFIRASERRVKTLLATVMNEDLTLQERREVLSPLAGDFPFMPLVQAIYKGTERPVFRGVEPIYLYDKRMRVIAEITNADQLEPANIDRFIKQNVHQLHPFIVEVVRRSAGPSLLNYGASHCWDLADRISTQVGPVVLLRYDEVFRQYFEENPRMVLRPDDSAETLYGPEPKLRHFRERMQS